ncbi:MAG: threonylcarbamoyl-AMP synthase [Anaerolineales bacterium]|nr:MAG: threonylcarbamoyl-AMP synthase [Anaerolineales bacterium]
MKTVVLPAYELEKLSHALQVLKDGGLVAFPTDTVYGLGAMAFNPQAIVRLYQAKGRSSDNPIPVLIASATELTRIALKISPMARQLAARFWPGPVTLVVWRRLSLPKEISATPTVGVRVPDHALAQALLTAAGPLAVTSANRSNQPTSRTAAQVLDGLDGRIDLILDGGKTPGGEPSTVVDCTQAIPQILRPGPIREQEILESLTKT